MSLIFDALQRSVGERSEVDLSKLSTATELLQRVERQTVSEREAEAKPQFHDAADIPDHDPSPALLDAPPIGTLDSPRAEGSFPNVRHLDLFAQFKSIPISIPDCSQLVCLTDSDSLAAEKFRFLAVRLRHLQRERILKKILITSTIPCEGKSTVSGNLACAFARKKQQRTLLVDGDLRRPSLARIFGLGTIAGLSEWLQGERSLTTSICHLEVPGFWILSAGRASANPLELLQSGKLPSLMDQLTALFDWIIIDSPPVLPLADTSVWSRSVDGILLVTRQGTTKKRQLQKGLEAIESNKLIGALLNSSHSSAHNDYYYQYHHAT